MLSTVNVVNALGRMLVGVGLLVFAFAGFQLWGTSLAESRAQDELGSEFQAMLDSIDSAAESGTVSFELPTSDPGANEAAPVVDPTPFVQEVEPEQLPELGQASGRIFIPALGVEKTIVHGIARDDLRLGPGHYPKTAWPGQPGNTAIAGHRTTHGSPFLNLDRLSPGDDIFVQTVQGLFKYEVQEHQDRWGHPQGHFIVDPHQVDVLEDFGDNRLTLTACHPRYSAAQRLIVTATLVSEPAPVVDSIESGDGDRPGVTAEIDDVVGEELVGELYAAERDRMAYLNSANGDSVEQREAIPDPTTTPDAEQTEAEELAASQAEADNDQPTTVAESLGWQPQHWPSTAAWGALTGLVMTLAWLLGRRWRRLPAYGLALAPFLYCLYWTFTFMDKMLPAV